MTKLNSEQRAPASVKCQPDELAGLRVGDLCDVPNLGRVEIVELLPPSLLKVRTQSGGLAKVGYRVCQRA